MKRLDSETKKGIDYSADISRLEEYYQKQYELIKNGNTDLATLELVMLGNALDFIDYAGKSFGIELTAKEKSVSLLDEVLDALVRGISQKNLFAPQDGNIAVKASSYLGLIIISNVGGEWTDTENGAAVNVNGRTAYVYDFIKNRLQNLTETTAEEYYKSVRIARK